MQPNLFPFGSVVGNPFLGGVGDGHDLSEVGFESSRVFFLVPFLLLQGGGMDLSKVGERILSSVRSARSLGLLPSTSDRPEVPAEAAAAAAVARALAGLPPHQRYSLSSSSAEFSSIYGSKSHGQELEELEDCFYEENFDAIGYILENVPDEENELSYFEKQEALRLAQLDRVAEHLSRNVMEHHEVMVKGMHLVRELERDLKVANVICMNGRRHLTSSMNEVSRDLIVNSHSKKKQALQDVLPILSELRRALDMQMALEFLVEEGNYCRAFQVLSEFLQLLDSFSELSAMQEMSRGVEVWLGKTLQKLDSLLIGVCQEFKEESYLTVVDASALIGDISGLADKIQSFFMQEVFSETHSVLKTTLLEDQEPNMQNSRLTYSDLCQQIPESKFRQCLLRTLSALFKLMCSYYEIMSFQPVNKLNPDVLQPPEEDQNIDSATRISCTDQPISTVSISDQQEETTFSRNTDSNDSVSNGENATSSHESPFYQLRKDATAFVSQTLQRGCKNLWQLLTSRVSVLLSSASVHSTSIHQFLKIYEDLNTFILAGEAFCGVEAVEFRQKLKDVCENYFAGFHRQNIYALKMVIEKEDWQKLSPDTVQVISFPGLVGDGSPLINPADKNNSTNSRVLHSTNSPTSDGNNSAKKSGFSFWVNNGNPYLPKIITTSTKEYLDGSVSGEFYGDNDNSIHGYKETPRFSDANHTNGKNSFSDDENEDLLADFIDEDSQLPSRISNRNVPRNRSAHWTDDEIMAQTGSSLCLLRSMDRYARLMQKLEIVNVEFFKGMCQLFEIFFHYVFETFGQQNSTGGKSSTESLNYRLKAALSRVTQDCEEWLRPQSGGPFSSSSSPTAFNSSFSHVDVTPTSPRSRNFGHTPSTSFGLKERCAGADSISLVARILHRSKGHLQSALLLKNGAIVEDFFAHLVDPVPELTQHIHKTTARSLLHINGYVDRVANAKWEVKELGLEHNGYVDLLLGEFKHYKTRLNHGGIQQEVQELLLEYGVDIVAETLVEGLSRVKRCTDEGRALMSLDLQVLISGLQHFVSESVKPKFLIVETFIKAYYLPETEYVHWARAHPEYTKNQIVGLVNLVAAMKGWKRKSRLEVLEKI